MGSDFADFIQQPFVTTFLGLVCFFAILLVAVVAYIVYARNKKTQAAVTPSYSYTPTPTNDQDYHLPDLHTLTDTSGFAQEQHTPPPAAPAPARAVKRGTFNVKPNDGASTEAVEVMTILRDVVDGKLIVQMGDKAYQNFNNDAEFKDRLTKVMRELAQVAAAKTAAPPPAETDTDAEVETTTEAPPVTLGELMESSAPVDQPDEFDDAPVAYTPPPPPPPRPAPKTPSGMLPGDLPSFALDDQGPIKAERGKKRDVKPVPELNIAGAIEAYLQHKLRQTPEYNGRSIHIYPSPDGGVSIEVDGSYFDAVGDITDTEIREFLATTIQEWQDRH